MPRDSLRREEMRSYVGSDGIRVVLEGQLHERCSLHVKDADGVERDVNAARYGRHRIGVLVDGLFVKGVDLRCLGHSACSGDILGHRIELRQCATGQEDLCSLSGEGAGYCIADGWGAALLWRFTCGFVQTGSATPKRSAEAERGLDGGRFGNLFRVVRRRVLLKLRQRWVHLIPRLRVRSEDIELRKKPARVIQTRSTDAYEGRRRIDCS